MIEFYMDTNVFISGLKPDDPFYPEAKAISKAMRGGEMHACTSTIALLELASVSARLYDARKGVGSSSAERNAFVLKSLETMGRLKIRFISILGDSPLSIGPSQIMVPSLFYDAIRLAFSAPLRSLDLIHLASARYAKIENQEIEAFVTGDSDFLSKSVLLSEILGMPVLSPQEFLAHAGH